MKRSELVKIVNKVIEAEGKKLDDAVYGATDEGISKMFAVLVNEVPVIAAETTFEILINSGIAQIEPDDEG